MFMAVIVLLMAMFRCRRFGIGAAFGVEGRLHQGDFRT